MTSNVEMTSKTGIRMRRVLPLILALAMVLGMTASPAHAQGASGQVRCYVERANIQGDPGNPSEEPADAENFELFETVEGSAPEYLKTAGLGRRFAHLLATEDAGDGGTNAYYVRGLFTYIFDIYSEMGEMTISGVTYKGGEPDQYRVVGKYEEEIIIPDSVNGLMPVNTSGVMKNAYCAGWSLDERTEDKALLTYSQTVSEHMLPTDSMPYEGLEFKLTGVWFDGQDKCVMEAWYEQLPEEEAAQNAKRMTYNGKTYINYPATNWQMSVPKGSRPSAASVPGLSLVTIIEPDEKKPYPEGSTWQFVYSREGATLSFNTNGAGEIKAVKGVKYQHNLREFDPGWTRETVINGKKFAGWFYKGAYVSDSLSSLYMVAHDMTLEARWE